MPAPAPHLTSAGRCSDCGVHAMPAGDGDLKVCPHCYALLWHADYSTHERQRKAEALERATARAIEQKRRRQAIIDERIRVRREAEKTKAEIADEQL
jgi:hypothetical protein